MKTLQSSFKDNNFEAVKAFLDKSKIMETFGKLKMHIYEKSAPQLWFFDENEIESGYYQFKIDGMLFTECWVEKFGIDSEGRKIYCSGSYRVVTI